MLSDRVTRQGSVNKPLIMKGGRMRKGGAAGRPSRWSRRWQQTLLAFIVTPGCNSCPKRKKSKDCYLPAKFKSLLSSYKLEHSTVVDFHFSRPFVSSFSHQRRAFQGGPLRLFALFAEGTERGPVRFILINGQAHWAGR